MKIRSKLILLFGTIVLLNAIGGTVVAFLFRGVEADMRQVRESSAKEAIGARNMFESLISIRASIDRLIGPPGQGILLQFEGSPIAVYRAATNEIVRFHTDLHETIEAAQAGVVMYKKEAAHDELKLQQAELQQLEHLHEEFDRLTPGLQKLQTLATSDPDAANEFWHETLLPKVLAMTDRVGQLSGNAFAEMLRETDEVSAAVEQAHWAIFSTLLIALLGAMMIAFYAGSNISRPLRQLDQAVRATGSGRRDQTVHLRRNDELGSLSESFNCMTASLRETESELYQAVADLRGKNAELKQFTHTVSHDLKSPLITIQGFLGALEQDLRDDREIAKEDLRRIKTATDHMAGLLENLIELSRIGVVCNPPEPVDFREIADTAVNNLDGRLKQKGVQILMASKLPVVSADRIRIVEAMQNLVENATKYLGNEATPKIEIGCRDISTATPTFFVRDNGIGIDPDQHDRIFGLFHKIDRRTDGTGIGLALTKRIIEFHGGRIWVESDGLGKGSTFCFTLPTPNQEN